MLLAALLIVQTAPAQETVTVYRDELGLPHVYADSDEGVAYGLGRVHFRDRPVRTAFNLALAVGNLLETVGQLDPKAKLEDDDHFVHDRQALRYQRVERATWLWNHYQRPGAPAEDQTLVRLIKAFVKGMNDERQARPKDLAAYFLKHLNDLPEAHRLTAAQFDALFGRSIEDWEPLALANMTMRSFWEDLLDEHGQPGRVRRFERLLPAGSNSWVVPSGGSATDHTFVYSDSHQPSEWYISVRFKARKGTLDGGGFTVSGLPFLLSGFAANVGWAVTIGLSDPVDYYTYDGDVTTSPGTFVDEEGRVQPLVVHTRTLRYRHDPGGPLSTLAVTDRYLDAEEDIPVTAIHPGREGHAHLLYAIRFSMGDPKPPTPKDPGCDPLRMLHRLLTARDADDFVQRGIGGTLSFSGLNLTVGDSSRAIGLLVDRIPYRKCEIPFTAGWQSYSHVQHMSGGRDGWVLKDGRLFHPVTDFPTIRSDGKEIIRAGKRLLFWANCNTTPQWLLGLDMPPGYPDSAVPYDAWHADYVNPFDPAAYVRMPTGVTGMTHFGPSWGSLTVRQEWFTTGLKVAWDAEKPRGISEATLLALMTDHHDPFPVYLERFGFFSELLDLLPGGPEKEFAAAIRAWARDRLAPEAVVSGQDAVDAARFGVFWELFRREMQGPWSRAWGRPFRWEFFTPRDHADVKIGALKALALAVGVFKRYPDLDLASMQRFPIPFGGPNLAVPGTWASGHMVASGWVNPPWESARPLRSVVGGGRMPMLMRMRRTGESHHRIQLMCPAHPGRVMTLPEWTAAKGPNFHAAPIRWAQAMPYDLPMTESRLIAIGWDAQVTRRYSMGSRN